jgi:hypothetical protein
VIFYGVVMATADFSAAAANAPPSGEMTGLGDRGWVTGERTGNGNVEIDGMGPGAKRVKNAQRDSLGHPSRKTWLSLCSLSAKD